MYCWCGATRAMLRYLAPAGITAGFCYAIKFPGGLVAILAVVFAVASERGIRARQLALLTGTALAVAAPWILRDVILTGNPVAPQRRDGHSDRRDVYRGPVRRAGGGRYPGSRHGAGPDRGRQPVVGSLMMTAIGEVDWKDPEVSIPGFLTMLAIPLTFSIANGLAFGFIAYTVLKVARGKFREVNWLVWYTC